nr:helix-turn-helix transcriptional regulator [Mucilaginibacter sp. AK015]
MYGEKIRTIRELRGFSQENVAAQLGIAQNTYSKIETNQTKLTTDTLTKIAEVLEVSPMDIISNQPAIVNFQPNHGTQGIGHIEHFYAFQKDLFDKIIASKDEEIDRLVKIIEQIAGKGNQTS